MENKYSNSPKDCIKNDPRLCTTILEHSIYMDQVEKHTIYMA